MNRRSDITERALLDLVYSLNKAACWYLDETGVYWDDRLYDLYEMKQGQGIDMDAFQDKVFPKDLDLFNEVIRGAIKDPKPFEVNVRIFIQNRFQWVRISGIPSGNGLIGVTQNIDELFRTNKDAEQLLSMVKTLSETGSASLESIRELLKKKEDEYSGLGTIRSRLGGWRCFFSLHNPKACQVPRRKKYGSRYPNC